MINALNFNMPKCQTTKPQCRFGGGNDIKDNLITAFNSLPLDTPQEVRINIPDWDSSSSKLFKKMMMQKCQSTEVNVSTIQGPLLLVKFYKSPLPNKASDKSIIWIPKLSESVSGLLPSADFATVEGDIDNGGQIHIQTIFDNPRDSKWINLVSTIFDLAKPNTDSQ